MSLCQRHLANFHVVTKKGKAVKRTWSILAFAAAAGIGTQALALPTPVSSHLSLQATATAGSTTNTDTDGQNQGATLNPLAATVSALASEGSTAVSTSGSATAAWFGSDAGSVNFRLGWTAEGAGATWAADLLSPGIDWEYTFTPDHDGQLLLDFAITMMGDTFGLNGFNFHWSADGSPQLLSGSSNLARDVLAGVTYTVGLDNLANIFNASDTRTATMIGEFNWEITEVDDTPIPEPATLALMGIGLAALGFRRRRVSAR